MPEISYATAFWQACKEFLDNSSFHGLSHITQPRRHWIERIFWILCCILAWAGAISLILSSWDDYQNNAISFVPDTTYLDWDTDFPSVTVCEGQVSKDRATEFLKNNSKLNKSGYIRNMQTLLYGYINYAESQSIQQNCAKKPKSYIIVSEEDCPTEDLDTLIRMLRSPCEEVFKKCMWNEIEFDCCQYFLPLDTEYGVCYSINNMNTNGSSKSGSFLDMKSNRTTGPGRLKMEFKVGVVVYYSSNVDVPNFNSKKTSETLLLNDNKLVLLALTEVQNAPGVRSIPISKRQCKFHDEIEGITFYEHYSNSACEIECLRKKMKDICNCTSPALAKGEKMCDLKGVTCLIAVYSALTVLINPWENRSGLVCSCMQNCEEMEIDKVLVDIISKNGPTMMEIKLAHLPTVRYIRKIVRDKLDMVVSLGGTAGLFVGASLLSVIEVIFFLLVHPILKRICTSLSSSRRIPSEPHMGSTYENALSIHHRLDTTKGN